MNDNASSNTNRNFQNRNNSNQNNYNNSGNYNNSYNNIIGSEGTEERRKLAAMEVVVEGSVEKAMKILKRKLIKEGLFKELKARKHFEKPCEERKRKGKEMAKNARRANSQNKKSYII